MNNSKKTWGWFFYDWACQPYNTLMVTFIMGPYFATVAAEYFIANGLDSVTSRANAQYYWSLTITIVGLIVGLTAPFIGAIADTYGNRIKWIYLFSALLIIGAFSSWFGLPDGSNWHWILISFGIGFVGAELAYIFSNAQLPSLGDRSETGAISGSGFGFGYVGGLVSLVVVLTLFVEQENGKTLIGFDPIFGLNAEAKEGTRFVGPFVAMWFILFSIPYFMWINDKSKPRLGASIGKGLEDLWKTIISLRNKKSTIRYLISNMFYRDSLNGLYSFGGVYAALVLDWSIVQIGTFGIVAALAAAVCSWLGGKWDRRVGPKPVILISILILTGVCIIVVGMSRVSFFGIPLAENSSIPDNIFYGCGVLIGGFGGTLQSASRTMMVRHTNTSNSTQYFGIYGLIGRATAFLAPALIAYVTAVTNSNNLGISPLILLFLIGLFLMLWVNPEGDAS
jgi:UMF1 family MFS transporter